MELNLFPFTVEALGNNKKVYKDIDKLYQEHKYKFYKAAKEHELYNHQIVKEGSLIQEKYCKKVLGILAGAGEDESVYIELEKIIQKGFRWTYVYAQNHKKIEISKYLNAFIKKHNGTIDSNGIPMDYHFNILLFLNSSTKSIVQDKTYNEVLTDLLFRLNHYNDSEKTRISIDRVCDADKVKIVKLKQAIYKEYGPIRNFDDIIKDEYEAKRMESCAFLFDYEKISSTSIFEDIKFTNRDIDEILYLYIIDKKDLEDVKGATEFLITYMYVRYLIKAYKQVKEMYFANNKETMFVELEGLEKELNSTEERLFNAKQDLEKANDSIQALEKENAKLKAELAEEKKNRNELNALREFVFSLDKQEEYVQEEINMDFLQEQKAIIIGGHERWQQRMKELLPNFIFIHPDNMNFDTRLLDGVNIVFIYANYLNHAIYFRAMSAVSGKDVKVAYINKQNEDLVLRRIYKTIKGL